MRRVGKRLGQVILTLILFLGVVWVVAPREPVDTTITFETSLDAESVDAHFAEAEAAFPDIVPGTEKRVVWARGPGLRTGFVVLYVHGFSASAEEIRPVPDRVAEALDANLIFTRLTGHGRDGPAMADASVNDWVNDMAEAMEAARAVGDQVIVVSTSTGGTLSALAAATPSLNKGLAGLVFVSPNFRVASPAATMLTWPGARIWAPWIAGEERSYTPMNAAHDRFNTTRYPFVATLPMAALVRHVNTFDFGNVEIPALFVFSWADLVVDASATQEVAETWGGPVTLAPVELPPGNDSYHHVITGDMLSPDLTEPVIAMILDWHADL